MAPRTPAIVEEFSSMNAPHKETKDVTTAANSDVTLSRTRKIGMCAGLMATDAMAMFNNLYNLPLLQTLGTPVSLVTVPGVVAAIMSLSLVPLLGHLADAGSQPHRRKKPMVIYAFCVALLGLSCSLAGNALHVWGPKASGAPSGQVLAGPVSSVAQIELARSDRARSAARRSSEEESLSDPFRSTSTQKAEGITNLSGRSLANLSKESRSYGESDRLANPIKDMGFTSKSDITVSPGYIPTDSLSSDSSLNSISLTVLSHNAGFSPYPKEEPESPSNNMPSGASTFQSGNNGLSRSSVKPALNGINSTVEAESVPASAQPGLSVLGLPVAALLGMAGLVFMDLAFDLSNTTVKTCMLTFSTSVDHVSLLMTGVFMSALGGCIISVFGLVDVSQLMPDVDPFCSQVIVQLLLVTTLSILCCSCTLLSTRAPASAQGNNVLSVDGVEKGLGGFGGELEVSTVSLQTEVQENLIMAITSPVEALMSTSTRVEHPLAGLSFSLGSARSTRPSAGTHNEMDAATTRLLPKGLSSRLYQTIHEGRTIPSVAKPSKTGKRMKLFIIWLSTFFTGCSIFTFIITVADYMGKVVYGGDPAAEAKSTAHVQYEQGVRSASLSMLVLSVAYVLFSLCHSKVLAALGHKKEYLLINLTVVGLLLAVSMTGNVIVVYVTSAVIGLNRATLYTVPFVLANDLCQAKNELTSAAKGEGQRRVGSMIALVTCALPSSYLVIGAIIGPLIDLTGDPSAPMLMAAVCSVLAVATIACYRS